jgi:hypothetical protein
VVRYIFSLSMKHSPKGTGCISGAVMPDCQGYLPTYGSAGAGQLALIYYDLNCRVLSANDPRRNLTVRFVVYPGVFVFWWQFVFFDFQSKPKSLKAKIQASTEESARCRI